MITRTDAAVQIPHWQKELSQAIREPQALLRRLGLEPSLLAGTEQGHRLFPIRVTESYLSRIRPGDPDDPLLRQVLPALAERNNPPGFAADPVGDQQALAAPGLLHKYAHRCLLLVSSACAIHCRYCFRRNFPYNEARAENGEFAQALAYIAAHPDISEVILSGGDPLSLNDPRMRRLVSRLEAIPHLETLRIHSRLPVVLPARITDELLETLQSSRLQAVMVIHANHAREIDAEVGEALTRLAQAGVTLLNQAVLLKGVNDRIEVLAGLSRTLFRHGVLPYYLHLLDRASNTAHFEVSETEATSLMQRLRHSLPGYLLPQLVREQAGAASKLPVV